MSDDRERLAGAALVLVAHGSSKNAHSRRAVLQHGIELRRRGLFAEVHEAFYKEPPWIRDTWTDTRASDLFVIPVFMSEGYFTQTVVPRDLGVAPDAARNGLWMVQRGARTLRYGRPVGTHPKMTEVLLARIDRVLSESPDAPAPETIAVIVAGHGTTRDDRSREIIDRQVAQLRGLNRFGEVHAAFMEEELRIADYPAYVQAADVVVVPFFVSDGMHVLEDIPVLLGESEAEVCRRLEWGEPVWTNPAVHHGKRIWYTPSVGTEPVIAEVILERLAELLETD